MVGSNMLYLPLFLLIFSLIEARVLFVFKLIRHGARSPIKLINSRDYVGEVWNKKGIMTKKGREQLQDLGKTSRRKYILEQKLLSKEYVQDEILMISTNYNRTIYSGHLFFKAMYPNYVKDPPIRKLEKNDPFNFLEDNKDEISKRYKSNKIRLIHLINNFLSDFSKKYKSTLSKSSYIPKEIFSEWKYLFNFCDAFICDIFEKRNLTYLNTDLKGLNESVKECYNTWIKMFDYSSTLSGLYIHPIIKKISEYIQERINKQTGPKAIFYFAHDSTISLFLNYLKKINLVYKGFDYSYIDFAANITIELIEENDIYYIIIY